MRHSKPYLILHRSNFNPRTQKVRHSYHYGDAPIPAFQPTLPRTVKRGIRQFYVDHAISTRTPTQDATDWFPLLLYTHPFAYRVFQPSHPLKVRLNSYTFAIEFNSISTRTPTQGATLKTIPNFASFEFQPTHPLRVRLLSWVYQ